MSSWATRQRLRALALASLWANACGYHLAGTQVQLPADIRSVAVGEIENATAEHGWEKMLSFAFEREITWRRQLRWEPDPLRGDAVISGRVRSVSVKPVAFNSRDQAVQYQVSAVVDLTLSRRDNGDVLWQSEGLRVVGEYVTNANVIVTSAAAFQLQPLDAANLRDPQWNPQSAVDREAIHVQLAEGEKRQLLERLAQQLARDAYNAMIEDF